MLRLYDPGGEDDGAKRVFLGSRAVAVKNSGACVFST